MISCQRIAIAYKNGCRNGTPEGETRDPYPWSSDWSTRLRYWNEKKCSSYQIQADKMLTACPEHYLDISWSTWESTPYTYTGLCQWELANRDTSYLEAPELDNSNCIDSEPLVDDSEQDQILDDEGPLCLIERCRIQPCAFPPIHALRLVAMKHMPAKPSYSKESITKYLEWTKDPLIKRDGSAYMWRSFKLK